MNSKASWKIRKKYGSVRKKINKEYRNIINNRLEEVQESSLYISSTLSVSSSSALSDNIKRNFEEIEPGASTSIGSVENTDSNEHVKNKEGSVDIFFASSVSQSSDAADNIYCDYLEFNDEVINEECILSSSDTDTDDDSTSDFIKNLNFRNDLRKWAVEFNIPQVAIRDLSKILNNRIPNILPVDPRTMLHTTRNINLKPIAGGGEYWHNGIIMPLTKILRSRPEEEIPEGISLNFNFDGLPIHKSSKQEFWPILCNIFEIPEENPFIIGIYCGNGKPKDLDAYLNDFVEEMLQLINAGIYIQEFAKTIRIHIRCFICDSPARAFIKGVCNFNGRHGCQKCCVVGEYSHKSHTVTFPQTRCPARTGAGFRQKVYGEHHRYDSPLLKLPIDMVLDFPVGDSLHLIDLGIMKRMLTGWRDGNYGKYLTKWRASDIANVNHFLSQCKMPSEIHRAVRQLDTPAHWKASEFRTFLFYLSVVILPDVLRVDVMEHFLALFCAITICSTQKYRFLLELANSLLYSFVENYDKFYGADYITSNVHNLTHITDEVERLGPLQNFNAYPFENKLYVLNNMLRQGNKALSQVAKRLGEGDIAKKREHKTLKDSEFVILKKKASTLLKLRKFEISVKPQDKYFMTKNKDIIEFEKVNDDKGEVCIHGKKFLNKTDLFLTPVKSSFLNIYKISTQNTDVTVTPQDIMCKVVVIEHKNVLHVLPLLHTFIMK